jgi:GTP cyclohydrolase IA
MMDEQRLANAVREILLAIGEDPDRPELQGTPPRAAKMYAELFGGLHVDPGSFLTKTLPDEHRELIAIRDIAVRSMCEHHLVPMVGIAHVAYIPNGRIVGFDRLIKVVDALSRRPQVQERLTGEIADVIQEHLQPSGVAVMLILEQMCMTIRGERQTSSRTISTSYRGLFEQDASWREEFRTIISLPEAARDTTQPE